MGIEMEKRGLTYTEIQEIPDKSLMLLVGLPGVGKSFFGHQIALHGLAMGKPVIFVTTEQGPNEVIGLLKEKGLGEFDGLNFVDAFTETVGLTCEPRTETVCANCADLNSLSIAITKLREMTGKKSMVLVLDSLTSPYLFNGMEIVKFMRLFLSKFAFEGNSVLALMDEGCGKEEELGAIRSVADGIIRMEIKENSRIINVVKHPKVAPTRIETRMTWSAALPRKRLKPEVARRILKGVFFGRRKAIRTEVGDFVNIFWRNLVSWSGMLWDPKRFPTMAYELDKQMEFEVLREGLSNLPWRTKILLKSLMPKNFSEMKSVKKLLSRQGKPMQDRGMRIAEYIESASKRNEHHIKIFEGYNCWGMDNVGAPLAFQDCGLMAGAFKAIEKGERDWNVVETKCIGRGDPYCEMKAVPGECPEMSDFLEAIDSSVVENVHDRLMGQLVGFLVHGQPLVERPRLGSKLSFIIIYHVVTIPSLISERYRMALRMGGAKAGKEVGEHLLDAGLSEDEAVKRVAGFLEHCKVGKITLGETIRMRENCEAFGLEIGELSCFFTTGFLNGLFSTVKNQHIRETKCIAAGDPYCEWEFR